MADAVDSKSTDSNILWVQVSFLGPYTDSGQSLDWLFLLIYAT